MDIVTGISDRSQSRQIIGVPLDPGCGSRSASATPRDACLPSQLSAWILARHGRARAPPVRCGRGRPRAQAVVACCRPSPLLLARGPWQPTRPSAACLP